MKRNMRKLVVFNHVTLDGYFVDMNGDMSWAKADHQDTEWNEFVAGNASGGGVLVFGRVTYELMASFWPAPFAIENMPIVAKGINSMPKGRTMFDGIKEKLPLKRTKTRAFGNGNVLLCYEPML
ncbi:MAG: dihydrofolate reductase family protein [bacterium]